MSLINPLYISQTLQEAEAPPRDSSVDSFNSNNLICAGTNNTIRNSRRCTIINSSNQTIEDKYNTHIVGLSNSSWSLPDNNILYVLCLNGMKVDAGLTNKAIRVDSSGGIIATGDVIASSSSDLRLKTNIKPLVGCLNKLSEIKSVSFNWNTLQSTQSGKDIGLIAQQVEKQFPEVCTIRKNSIKAIDYKKMTAVLVACVKEKQERIEKLYEKLIKLNESK